MGEGPYSEIIYGLYDASAFKDYDERLCDILQELGAGVSSSYDSGANVFGITILTTLSRGYSGDRSLSVGICRVDDLARVMNGIVERARKRYYDRETKTFHNYSEETFLDEAKRQWKALQERAKVELGLDIPDGELVWNEDYA